jgi:ABC-type protease/lipase transport system fused ATPase/permease subunit
MSKPGSIVSPARHVLKDASAGFVALGIFSFFVNLSVLVSPIYMQQIFDRVLQTRNNDTLIDLTLITVLLLAVFAILDGVRTVLLGRLGQWWDDTLRDEVITAAIRAARVRGQASATVVNDLQTVRTFVGSAHVLPFFDAPWMPLFIIVIAMLHPMLGVIALVSGVMLLVMALWTEHKTRRVGKDTSERQARLTMMTNLALRHTDSIHAMAMEHAVHGDSWRH